MTVQHRSAVFYFKSAKICFKISNPIAVGEFGNRFYICATPKFIFQIHYLWQIYDPDFSTVSVQ